MKKRWIPVIAGLMLALLPAGCGKTDASEPGAKPAAEEVPAQIRPSKFGGSFNDLVKIANSNGV